MAEALRIGFYSDDEKEVKEKKRKKEKEEKPSTSQTPVTVKKEEGKEKK